EGMPRYEPQYLSFLALAHASSFQVFALGATFYPKGEASFFSENAADGDSCARLRRIFTCTSRTSTSKASSAWRRDMACLIMPATIFLRKVLASLSTLRLMVDSCTPNMRATSAKVRPSR